MIHTPSPAGKFFFGNLQILPFILNNYRHLTNHGIWRYVIFGARVRVPCLEGWRTIHHRTSYYNNIHNNNDAISSEIRKSQRKTLTKLNLLTSFTMINIYIYIYIIEVRKSIVYNHMYNGLIVIIFVSPTISLPYVTAATIACVYLRGDEYARAVY